MVGPHDSIHPVAREAQAIVHRKDGGSGFEWPRKPCLGHDELYPDDTMADRECHHVVKDEVRDGRVEDRVPVLDS
jgi:hypothetical protein